MYITHAAIMFKNGDIIEGHNYSQISSLASRLGFSGDKIRGFLTSTGEFVLPDEALTIALESHQVSNITETLTPEDLWPVLVSE